MERGSIYLLRDKTMHKTMYRLESHNNLDNDEHYFWYKNKFGEGYTWKHREQMNKMELAPKIYQVLYGKS